MAPSKKKTEMGKGIRALLANIDTEEATKKKGKSADADDDVIGAIDLDLIETNPYQPRSEFDEEELNELAESIKTFGIIQPLTLRKLSNREYQLISGERRFRAAKMAGLEEVPAYIREADDQAMLEIALLENIQRSDLNPLEVALSFQRLIEECDLTHEELSERLGKKRSSISNHLRILKLPAAVQKALKQKLVSMGHAKVIAGLEKTENQLRVLDRILTDGLSVRATEKLVNSLSKPDSRADQSNKTAMLPEVLKIRDQLSEKTGSKVEISRSASGRGTIKIHFGGDDEFNEVIESLLDD